MAEIEDSLLGRRLLDGDPSVPGDILAAYGPKVAGWLRKKFSGDLDREDIRDILGLAIAKLWNGRAIYDPDQSRLYTYLSRIAYRAAVDVVRGAAHASRRREVPLGPHADQIAYQEPASGDRDGPEGDRDSEKSRQIEDLRDCIRQLDASSRIILESDSIHADGVAPSRDLGELLNKRPGAIRSIRKRAWDKLRRLMEKRGYKTCQRTNSTEPEAAPPRGAPTPSRRAPR